MIAKTIDKILYLVNKSKNSKTQASTHYSDNGLFEFYKQFIKPGQLCFDVGASIGERTDIWLRLGARVICVEPQKGCCEVLRSKYGTNANVKVLQVGLASKPGVMALSICESANTISTFSEKWKTGRFKSYEWNIKYDVQMKTLDELVEEYGMPDFCKIDVEGFELEVLRGLSRPIRHLSFEFTSEFMADAQKCLEHLESIGKVEFNFALGDNLTLKPALGLERWASSQQLFNMLSKSSSDLLWGDIYARFYD